MDIRRHHRQHGVHLLVVSKLQALKASRPIGRSPSTISSRHHWVGVWPGDNGERTLDVRGSFRSRHWDCFSIPFSSDGALFARIGVSVATIASKLSMAIPVLALALMDGMHHILRPMGGHGPRLPRGLALSKQWRPNCSSCYLKAESQSDVDSGRHVFRERLH